MLPSVHATHRPLAGHFRGGLNCCVLFTLSPAGSLALCVPLVIVVKEPA